MLRRLVPTLLWIDALGGLGVGTLVLLLHDVLPAWYALSHAVVVGMGVANMAYGSCSLSLALTPRWRRPPAIAALSVANVLWGVVCWGLLATYAESASTLGLMTLVAEGTYVPALGLVEWWLRRDLVAKADARGPQWQLLECRVPPPVVALLVAAAMHAVARAWPGGLPLLLRPAGVAFGVAGLLLAVWAIASFRRAETTINPLTPHEASALVIAGPNRWSRNPMYVGMLLVLIGWGVWLGSAASLSIMPLAWVWLRRFQVQPEERALTARFGDAYVSYCARVRRWV